MSVDAGQQLKVAGGINTLPERQALLDRTVKIGFGFSSFGTSRISMSPQAPGRARKDGQKRNAL